MATQLPIGDLVIEVVRKDIKNVHLSVYPPDGRVRIAAPRRMKLDTIRVFGVGKLAWIREQQQKLAAQPRETRPEFVERESHYVWGRRYLLNIVQDDGLQRVELKHNRIVLHVRPGTTVERRAELMAHWRRQLLREEATKLVANWQKRLGVTANRLLIQSMKTQWGSCNPKTRNIRLNTELSKKPKQCLDYIILHELAHLLVPNHGDDFLKLLGSNLPHWRSIRRHLNELPLPVIEAKPTAATKRLAA